MKRFVTELISVVGALGQGLPFLTQLLSVGGINHSHSQITMNQNISCLGNFFHGKSLEKRVEDVVESLRIDIETLGEDINDKLRHFSTEQYSINMQVEATYINRFLNNHFIEKVYREQQHLHNSVEKLKTELSDVIKIGTLQAEVERLIRSTSDTHQYVKVNCLFLGLLPKPVSK